MYEISNDDDDDDDDDDEDDDGEFDEQTCGCVSLVVHLATTNCESNTFPGITMMMMTMMMMTMMMMMIIMMMMTVLMLMIMIMMTMMMMILMMMTHSWIWVLISVVINNGNINAMSDKRTFDDRNLAEYDFGNR